MPDAPISYTDLQKFDGDLEQGMADDMIATAWSRAQRAAPCLADDDSDLTAADIEIVKDVLRSAILRWAERGTGVVAQRTAGEYGETIRDNGSTLFRPNEIRDLLGVCGSIRKRGRASTISTLPSWAGPPTPDVHPFLTDTDGEWL